MVPVPAAVKAKFDRGGSGKPDYRNQLRNYGGVDVWFIEIYFTDAVRNENINCKGVGSFPEVVCFEVFPVRALWRDLVSFLIADPLNTVDSLPVKGGRLYRTESDYPYSDTFRAYSSITRIYGGAKGRFPLLLTTAKPRFYVDKFGRSPKVTL